MLGKQVHSSPVDIEQPYFAEPPYGLISVQAPAGEGGVIVRQQ
jgi:hypothetical protein